MPEFKTGDHVIYKNNGVCLVEDIRPISFGEKETDYYILRPLNREGTVYVPVNPPQGAATPQKVPEKTDLDTWIARAEHSQLKWIENSKMRIVTFDRILSSGNRGDILWLFKVLSAKKEEEGKRNKKLCTNEERILDSAEKIITDEFAFTLNLPKDKIVEYILEQIQLQKK